MKIKIHWQLFIGWIITFALIGSTFVLESTPPRFTEFYEGDLSLSYSLHDTVRYKYVIILSYVVPTILLCLFIIISKPRHVIMHIHDAIYISCRSFATNEIVTALLKNFVGRPRPCFFKLCEYESTTRTDPSGSLITLYGTYGMLGNVSKCHANTASIYSAFRSFPSGHSSTAMSAFVIIFLYLIRFIDIHYNLRQYELRVLKTALSILNISWTYYVVGSRIFDYRHRPEDVVGGIVVGALSALSVWVVHFPMSISIKQKTISGSGQNLSSLYSDIEDNSTMQLSVLIKPTYTAI